MLCSLYFVFKCKYKSNFHDQYEYQNKIDYHIIET